MIGRTTMMKRWIVVAVSAFLGLGIGSTVQALRVVPSMHDFVGFGVNLAADEAAYSAEEAVRQTAISDCMAARGFPYSPLPADFNVFAPRAEGVTYFGLIESYGRDADQVVSLVLARDPNVEYAESLPAHDKDSYYEALFGPNWSAPDQVAADYESSCTGAAYAETPGTMARATALRDLY